MRAYKAYDESGIKELGDVSKDQVLSLIEQADASLATAKQFGVGFYRTEKDFLEIRPVGKSQYIVWSDRTRQIPALASWGFSPKQKGKST